MSIYKTDGEDRGFSILHQHGTQASRLQHSTQQHPANTTAVARAATAAAGAGGSKFNASEDEHGFARFQ